MSAIVYILIGAVIGFIIAWYMISQQKFGDKLKSVDAKWEKKIAELEKKYEVKIEKIGNQWQIKYIKDIEELKRLFKESEKIIRQKSVSASRRSLVGKFIEKFIPFLPKFKWSPSDAQFLGQPIDYIVFDGLRDNDIKKIVFVEVKTGKSKLNKREKSLKDTIEKKKVYWKEFRLDTEDKDTGKTEKKIEKEETAIKEIYDTIDNKLKDVKKKLPSKLKEIEGEEEEEPEEFLVDCPHCGKELTIELDEDEIEDLENGVELEDTCPKCGKKIFIDETILDED